MWTIIIIVALGLALVTSSILHVAKDRQWVSVVGEQESRYLKAEKALADLQTVTDAVVKERNEYVSIINELRGQIVKLEESGQAKDAEIVTQNAYLAEVHKDLQAVTMELLDWTEINGSNWSNICHALGIGATPAVELMKVIELARVIERHGRSGQAEVIRDLLALSSELRQAHAKDWRPVEYDANARLAADSALADMKMAVEIYQSARTTFGSPSVEGIMSYRQKELAKIRDLAMLRLLKYLGKRIPLHRERNAVDWKQAGSGTPIDMVRWFLRVEIGEDYDPSVMRAILMDLVTHRNAEYMAALDQMPPDIAQYFLRLTVAEPKPEPKPAFPV